MAMDPFIPADVPAGKRRAYERNYRDLTRDTGRLMLFAGDQRVEHLNDDFYGNGAHPDDSQPEHLFRIAARARIGAFATQLGLISRYGRDYARVPYLVKLNSKTNLVKTGQRDPVSLQWHDVRQAISFRKASGLRILAVGYTVYLGSIYEAAMLHQAAQIVFQAHEAGLVTVLWMYPRGKAVENEKAPHLIAGAAGVAACPDSDFAKMKKTGEFEWGSLRPMTSGANTRGNSMRK